MLIELLETEAVTRKRDKGHRGRVVDPAKDRRLKRNRGKRPIDLPEDKAAEAKDEGTETEK